MTKAIVLTAVTGSQIGRKYTLSGRTNVIGSVTGSDLVLHDRMVEPRHAELRQMLDRWFVVPLTTSGTGLSVNGISVHSQSRVNPGDKLTIGMTTYTIAVEELQEQAVGAVPQAHNGAVPRLGDYFLRNGLMTADQVRMTLERQASLQRTGDARQFGQLAYELGFINRSQLDRAVSEQRSDFNDRFRD